jgi:hypothetical protein
MLPPSASRRDLLEEEESSPTRRVYGSILNEGRVFT